MKGISNHKQDWFAQCCLTRLYTVKPELNKEVESDPELAEVAKKREEDAVIAILGFLFLPLL